MDAVTRHIANQFTARKGVIMAKEAKQSYVITLSSNRPLHDLVKEIESAGFDVDQVLDSINIVTGSAVPKTVQKVRGISGVEDVSSDHQIDIGPPDAPIS
jgi:hypothetical protein